MTKHKIYIYPDGRMKAKDAACYLGFSEGTLANWRVVGNGPRFLKRNGRIFYYRSDMDSWLQGNGAVLTTAQVRLTSVN